MSADGPFPYRARWVDHGGIRQHVLDEGPPGAPPVLMLHGNPTWSFFYRRLVEELRTDHRVLVPDHVGMGRSDKPSSRDYPYSLARRVQDVEHVLERLDVTDPLTLVVHDWGGMIGMAWATDRPERVARVVVLNTAAFPLPAVKRLPWQIALCRAPLLGPLLTCGLNAFVEGALRTCMVRPLPREVAALYREPYDTWAHRRAVLEFVRTIPLRPGDEGWDLLQRTAARLELLREKPVLICWGERDFVFDRHFREEWERRFPEARVVRLEDAGHYLLEDAGERVAAAVRDFVGPHG